MYNKPEVVILTDAISVIQGINKPCTSRENAAPHLNTSTAGAYEADE
jgi:hypothetical protein